MSTLSGIATPRASRGRAALADHDSRLATVALAALMLASAALGLVVAWRPIDYLVGHNMPDDAFYYFQTARSIVDGHGVSVDGEVWANGFHPLWMAILIPVYALSGGDGETPVHVALSLSALVTSASGLLLYLAARRLGLSAIPSLAGTAAYLLHPVLILMSVNGLETGLNVSTFVLVLYLWIACWQEPTTARRLQISAAAGLLVLSRTDYGIVAASMLVALAVQGRTPRAVLALAAPAIAMTAPWFIWNTIVFGSPVQVSAGALPYVEHQIFSGSSLLDDVRHSLALMREHAFETVPYFYFSPDRASASPTAAFVGAVAGAATLAGLVARSGALRQAVWLLAVPSAGLVALFVAHAGVRWYYREWYLIALFPLLALLIALLLEAIMNMRFRATVAAMLVTVIVAGTIPAGIRSYRDGWYPVQLDMLDAARWIEQETPPEARVGGFNSGIVGYFSGRTTVNLDGVMNPDAFEAIRERSLAAYVDQRRIEYVADFPFYLYFLYSPFAGGDWGVREVAAFDRRSSFQGPFTIYEVDHNAASPRR